MSNEHDVNTLNEQEQPLLYHLIELRNRLIRCVIVVGVIFLGIFYFANDVYHVVAKPLLNELASGTSMIATEVASPFLVPFKLSLMLSIFVSMPFILYQAWSFIAPGLYKHEKRLMLPILISSILLFYAGMCFAYFVVFPLIFGFFTQVAPDGVAVMTDISHYLNFVLKLFFAFGITFEIPIVTLLLVHTGTVTTERLTQARPYIIIGAFVIGMLLTPPDIFSQTFLAIPMWLLFEVGLVMAKWMQKRAAANLETDTP